MLFKKYQDFINLQINENVQNAKIWLKKRALSDKKEKTGNDKEVLTPEEVRKVETNPDFIKIRDLLRDNPGWVFAFTKFFFEEGVPFDEIKSMYEKIKEFRSVLNTLPMTVDKYADIAPSESDKRKGFERLGDDIEKLNQNRVVKKFVEKLPGDFTVANPNAKDKGTQVPSIRRAYQNASEAIKNKVAEIATAFEEFGKDSDGTIDQHKNKELQDLFFVTLKRYRNLNEVIQAALAYIKSANNAQISKFLQNIQKVNQKYGHLNGAEIIYNEGNILIIEVRSYFANKDLNSNTSHCIASSSHQWDNYVGSDSNFNKQYYIYNYNLSPGDNKSVIGITIEPKYKIRACHLKNDGNFVSEIKSYMNEIGVPFEILEPMTNEEIEIKKKRVIANKEIIKPNLSLEQVQKYYNDGGDPNAQQGKPLINSVSEDNLEKTKWLLEHGAMPNIGNAIKLAQNLEMIKLLVSHGATLSNEVFSKVQNDYDAIKYLIDAGMDVNFDHGLPLRVAAKNDRMDIVELLIKNKADVTLRRYMVIKWTAERTKSELLKYLLDKVKESKAEVSPRDVSSWLHWVETSLISTNEKEKQKTIEVLKNFAKDVFGEKAKEMF